MAEVVLIHGIAQEQEGPASLEARWLPAIADGIRAAGHAGLADRLWPDCNPRNIDVAMAAYGDLFLTPGAQGSDDDLDDLDSGELALAQALAAEWLNRAADRGQPADRDTAARELGYLEPGHEEMGVKEEAARAVLHAVTRLRWFGIGGMAMAERFVNRSLRQVTAYLTDPALQSKIQNRVLARIGPDTKVIIGHSLGSVVAYEIAASHLNTPLPLLLTLGSPLGLRSVIYDRLTPQPPVYPVRVRRWVNIADRNDLVAAEPDLTRLFSPGGTDGTVLESGWTVDNGAKPHEAEYYLRKQQVGRPIAEALGI
jgi:hypothetical protein